jgi:hypothetical protein
MNRPAKKTSQHLISNNEASAVVCEVEKIECPRKIRGLEQGLRHKLTMIFPPIDARCFELVDVLKQVRPFERSSHPFDAGRVLDLHPVCEASLEN